MEEARAGRLEIQREGEGRIDGRRERKPVRAPAPVPGQGWLERRKEGLKESKGSKDGGRKEGRRVYI